MDERFSAALVAVPRNSPTAKTMRVVVSLLRVPLPVKKRGGLAVRRRAVETKSSATSSVYAGLSKLLNPGGYFFIFFHLGFTANLIAVRHLRDMNRDRSGKKTSLPVTKNTDFVSWLGMFAINRLLIVDEELNRLICS